LFHTLTTANPSVSPPPTAPQPTPGIDQNRWFAEEVHPHGGQLKSYLRTAFPSVRDVDDVVQESYLRILKIRASQTIRSARGFLFTLARHIALDLVRRNRASPVDSVADLSRLSAIEEKPDAAEILAQQERIRLLARALAALPERTREIVVLRKLHCLSQREVAGHLEISEAAVEHHVSRGLKKCEAFLRRSGIESLYDERP
jgi:RNA polymerase sigma factor (sigma-70 family)